MSDQPLSASITIHVRYFETDQMHVAHHAHYFVWFEAARSEFCRVRGIDYTQMEKQGYYLPIVEAHCRYLAPALYDEEITVTACVTAARRRTLRMGYTVTRGETTLATGETYQLVVGPEKRPRTLPDNFYALFS